MAIMWLMKPLKFNPGILNLTNMSNQISIQLSVLLGNHK